MIIFLSGEDTYRLNQNRESVVASYQAKQGNGFVRVDASVAGAADTITDAIKSMSLFSEVKMILVSNIFANAKTAEALSELFKQYSLETDKSVVILATHPGKVSEAKPKELYQYLSSAKNLVREFKSLEGAQLQAWLKKEAAARNATFASGALARFTMVGGADSFARIHNLDKLTSYSPTITTATIDLLIKTETEPNVFEFIDALGSGRKTQAFALLSGELAFGRDPYYLLSMVMYQFRNMLMVKDFAERNISPAQIAQKTGVHPFVVKKMLAATARMTTAQVKHLYEDVIALEQGTKQGKRDLEDGLFLLALS